MKKILIITFIVGVLLLASVVSAAGWRIHMSKPVATCVDTDGGLNAGESGMVAYKRARLGRTYHLKDYTIGDTVFEHKCTRDVEGMHVEMWKGDCRALGYDYGQGARCRMAS